MNDLRILEQQQIESEQQLAQALAHKHRMQASVQQLSDQLAQQRYANGQARAELAVRHDRLAESTRLATDAQTAADGAEVDLKELGQRVQQALAGKRATLAVERRQERLLAELEQRASLLAHLLEEEDAKVQQLYDERERMVDEQRVLERELETALAENQRLDAAVAKARADADREEQELLVLTDEEKALQRRLAELQQELLDNEKQHLAELAAIDAEHQATLAEGKELERTKRELQEQISKATKEYHESWRTVIAIQEAEGHAPSKAPSETTEPPVLDLDRIRESVDAERKAYQAEMAAKEELESQVAVMTEELESIGLETTALKKRQQELEELNVTEGAKVREKKTFLEDFFRTLQTNRTKVAAYESEIDNLQDSHDEEVAAAKERAKQVELDTKQARKDLANTKEQMVKVDEELEKLDENYKANQRAVQSIKETIDELAEQLGELEMEKTKLTDEYDVLKKQPKRKVEGGAPIIKLQDSIDIVLKGMLMLADCYGVARPSHTAFDSIAEYPQLDSIDYVFDASISSKEQAKKALEPLRKDCKKRLDSAVKMRAELRQAQKREQQENRLVEEAAAAEAKRKADARDRRKKRLEKETDKDGAARKRTIVRKDKTEPVALLPEKKNKTYSDSKPRDLLLSFSQVGDDGVERVDEAKESAAPPPSSLKKKDDPVLPTTTQEKKVRWEPSTRDIASKKPGAKESRGLFGGSFKIKVGKASSTSDSVKSDSTHLKKSTKDDHSRSKSSDADKDKRRDKMKQSSKRATAQSSIVITVADKKSLTPNEDVPIFRSRSPSEKTKSRKSKSGDPSKRHRSSSRDKDGHKKPRKDDGDYHESRDKKHRSHSSSHHERSFKSKDPATSSAVAASSSRASAKERPTKKPRVSQSQAAGIPSTEHTFKSRGRRRVANPTKVDFFDVADDKGFL